MKCREAGPRLFLSVLLAGFWLADAPVRADEGIPALLQFAEQYQSKNPGGKGPPPQPAISSPSPVSPSPVETRPHRPVINEPELHAERNVLQRKVKTLQAQITKQQGTIALLEEELNSLHKTIRNQEEAIRDARPDLKAAAPSALGISAIPLGDMVRTLRKAITGEPDENEVRMLLKTAREKEHRLSEQLAKSQTLAADLKTQLQEQHVSNEHIGKEVRLKDAAGNEMQAIVGELRQRLADEERSLENARNMYLKLQETHAQTELESEQKGRELAMLNEINESLENTLAELKARAEKGAPDIVSLEQQVQALKKENTELSSLKETSQSLTRELAELRAKGGADASDKTTLQQQVQALKKENTELSSLKETSQSLTRELAELRAKGEADASDKTTLQQQVQALKKENVGLLSRKKSQLTEEELKKDAVRRNYAEGSMLGRDIASMLEERTGWGMKIDRDIVLAGIIDTVTGNPRLNQNEYRSALAESERLVANARNTLRKKQHSAGDAFIREFKARKGVRQSDSGFWYLVDYEGDTPVPDNATVDTVVKESLTDGTVIQDMDLNGQVLSQPLNAYPPLFREAIGYLKNHGSITLVVPPALAYGETGYPPHIPPDATMVYVLRIENVTSVPVSGSR